ncbi:MAG: methionyl aminopeptidase [Oscillospiraceae bacterium]|nr:methionyl aminopeptidase [Oscillospiraceae bacterium]
MITLKTAREISLMRDAGRIAGEALLRTGEMVKPGVTTFELCQAAHKYILACGAVPTFLHYNGFPASACISVNEEVIHGIPSKKRVLREGDLVSIDLGATYQGYVGDTARTFAVGRLGDIGAAVQGHCEARGYSVVRDYTGHGVGRALHEDPAVANFGKAGFGLQLRAGMTIAIEPMVNQGRAAVRTLEDHWTVVTRDGKRSAHFEHTVAITANGPLLLTEACADV